MKEFIKNNPTLAFGLGLPILLVLVFTLAAGLPNLTAASPKYDVVFATDYYTGSENLRINVINGRVAASFIGECNACTLPEVYRYNVSSGALQRIAIDLPAEARRIHTPPPPNPYNQVIDKQVVPVAIPQLANVALSDVNPSPDGFEFTYDERYNNGGMLRELFFSTSPSYENGPVLRKGTYSVRLPLAKTYYSSFNVRFIGWVVAQ